MSLVMSQAATLSPNTARPLRIGAGATESAGDYWFPGTVDEVAVYNAALPAATVQQHYAAGTSP